MQKSLYILFVLFLFFNSAKAASILDTVTEYSFSYSKRSAFCLRLYSTGMYTLKFYTKIRADGLVVQNISMGNFLFGKNQLQLFDKVFNQKYIFSKVGNALIPRRFYGQKKFHYRIIFDDRFQSVTNSRVIDHDLKKFKSKFEVDTSKISNSPIDCSEYASRFVKVTINKQFIKIIFFDLVLLEGKIKKENNSYSFYDNSLKQVYKFYVDGEHNLIMNFSSFANGVFRNTCTNKY